MSLAIPIGLHIFGITESQFTEKKNNKPTTTDFEITLKGFKIIRKDAVRKLETGIAIYASNSLKYSCKM